jgi:hypothetical protein
MEAMDRRSIATRNRKCAQAATVWLASRNVSLNRDRRCARGLHRQPTVAPAGRKSRHALNPVCGLWLLSPAPRNRPVSVPNAVERAQRSRRHCLRISIQARDQLDESRRSRPIHLMEYENGSATATN